MPEFQLFPGARGLDFEGGGSVKADHRGRIKVSDEQAERIRGSSAMHRYDSIIEIAPGRYTPKPDDRTCPACGRTAWPWHTVCARCGEPLPIETKEDPQP